MAATKKTINVKGSSKTVKGSDSTSVIDVIKVYGNSNTVKARNGNDQITVYQGKNHKIYGGLGADTVTLTKNAGTGIRVYGEAGNDTIKINGGNSNTINGGNGVDTITLTAGNNNTVYGGAGNDRITVSGGKNNKIYGQGNNDIIRIKGGSGHVIDGGAGNDNIYIDAGSVKSIDNSGGSDYIEIGKNAGNGIKVESGASKSYKLNANETVKVLGGNNHDIRLYGGADKVIIAGGSGHTVYTDGPTGTGDAGGNDIIVIQNGGKAKKIVAGNGNDVIAVANGAGNGSVIYTGLEDPSGKNSGKGDNTLNLLGGSGHNVYLGGTTNKVLMEAQDVTLNKYAGTVDDIRVRWSEEGIGTLRINCPSVSSSQKSALRLEGVNSWDLNFKFEYVNIKNANGVVSETQKALIIEYNGQYTRDVRSVQGTATGVYQWAGDNMGNTRLAVFVNDNGVAQYNWCEGNRQTAYDTTPVTAPGRIEITRWDSMQMFNGITFDDNFFTTAQITTAANGSHVL